MFNNNSLFNLAFALTLGAFAPAYAESAPAAPASEFSQPASEAGEDASMSQRSSMGGPPASGPAELSGSVDSMTWGALFSGDCMVEAGMRATFSSFGAASVTGQARSTDTGDTWRMRFEFFREDGSIVFSTGYYYIGMSNRNTWYPFSLPISFPPEYYASIVSARAYSRC